MRSFNTCFSPQRAHFDTFCFARPNFQECPVVVGFMHLYTVDFRTRFSPQPVSNFAPVFWQRRLRPSDREYFTGIHASLDISSLWHFCAWLPATVHTSVLNSKQNFHPSFVNYIILYIPNIPKGSPHLHIHSIFRYFQYQFSQCPAVLSLPFRGAAFPDRPGADCVWRSECQQGLGYSLMIFCVDFLRPCWF